jgi:CRISPR-associated protein Cmr4
MAKKSLQQFAVLGLYTETPLHCGAESGVGFVDQPIQRERHTDYPVIPGSTIKGVLRDEVDQQHVDRFFGAEKPETPGSVAFGDGVIVAFPVRSTGAPFHWVSCCFVLERLFRLISGTWTPPPPLDRGSAYALTPGQRLLLEEIAITTASETSLFGQRGAVAQVLSLLPPGNRGFEYTRSVFLSRFLVLHDDDFAELMNTGTEVVTRIKLNKLGTTAVLAGDRGNMFVEELVPPETLFAAPLRGDADFLTACKVSQIKSLRFGGDETIGRGVTHLTCFEARQGASA